MTTIPVSQLRMQLSDLAGKVFHTGQRICIEKNGKPFVAMVSLDDVRLLEAIEEKIDIEAAKAALRRNDFIEWEQAKKELGL
jgi:prevent-host-death family protein